MDDLRYIANVTTLQVDTEKCTGCGSCLDVCPHRVLALKLGKIHLRDKDACIECGACATNCPFDAIEVNPGTGCATLLLKQWLKEKGFPVSSSCC